MKELHWHIYQISLNQVIATNYHSYEYAKDVAKSIYGCTDGDYIIIPEWVERDY